jgi:hypothetical protein
MAGQMDSRMQIITYDFHFDWRNDHWQRLELVPSRCSVLKGELSELKMRNALRKRRLVILCLALTVGAIVLYWSSRDRHESDFYGVTIFGSTSYIEQVERSLRLLREQSPDAFKLTQRYAPRIEQNSRSGMRAYGDPPTFNLSEKTATYSDTWCAGSIAHDTYHSKLYHEYLNAHVEPVPDEAWSGKAKELECIHYQARVLREIGAPDSEITYVDHLDGSHFDLNGDGKATWIDYWLQDW